MFNIGDAVYHPANGAGIIANLERFPALAQDQRYYKIRILDSAETVLMVPVLKAENLGLRPAISDEGVQEVLNILASPPDQLPAAHKRRYKLCLDKLDTADITAIAEVIRDLTWRQIEHDHLNVPGRRIYKKALKLLTGELAVAQGVSLETAESQINEALETQVEQITEGG